MAKFPKARRRKRGVYTQAGADVDREVMAAYSGPDGVVNLDDVTDRYR